MLKVNEKLRFSYKTNFDSRKAKLFHSGKGSQKARLNDNYFELKPLND